MSKTHCFRGDIQFGENTQLQINTTENFGIHVTNSPLTTCTNNCTILIGSGSMQHALATYNTAGDEIVIGHNSNQRTSSNTSLYANKSNVYIGHKNSPLGVYSRDTIMVGTCNMPHCQNSGHPTQAGLVDSIIIGTCINSNVKLQPNANNAGITSATSVLIGNYIGQYRQECSYLSYQPKIDNSIVLGHNVYRCGHGVMSGIAIGNNVACFASGSIGSGTQPIFIGQNAATCITSTGDAVVIGHNAAQFATLIGRQGACQAPIVIGAYAMQCRTGCSRAIVIGQEARRYGHLPVGYFQHEIIIGNRAGMYAGSGDHHIYIGGDAATRASGSNNIVIGHNGFYNNAGVGGNVSIGTAAGSTHVTSSYSVYVGNCTAYRNLSNPGMISTYDVFIGQEAACQFKTSCHNIAIGYRAAFIGCNSTSNISIGSCANRLVCGTNNVTIGSFTNAGIVSSSFNTFINTQIGTELYAGGRCTTNNVVLGTGRTSNYMPGSCFNIVAHTGYAFAYRYGAEDTSVGCYNVLLGTKNDEFYRVSGSAAHQYNIGIGHGNLYHSGISCNNIAIGNFNLRGGSYTSPEVHFRGHCNIAIGYYAGEVGGLLFNNVFIGNQAGRCMAISGTCLFTACENIGIGSETLKRRTVGCENVAIGRCALYTFQCVNQNQHASGSYNVAIGYRAGAYCSNGDKNIYIGYDAGYYATGSNELIISNEAGSIADPKANAFIYGKLDTGDLAVKRKVSAVVFEPALVTLAGGTPTWNMLAGANAKINLTGNAEINASNITDGEYTLVVVQNATTAYEVIFTTDFKFPSGAGYVTSTRLSATDVLKFSVVDGIIYNTGIYLDQTS